MHADLRGRAGHDAVTQMGHRCTASQLRSHPLDGRWLPRPPLLQAPYRLNRSTWDRLGLNRIKVAPKRGTRIAASNALFSPHRLTQDHQTSCTLLPPFQHRTTMGIATCSGSLHFTRHARSTSGAHEAVRCAR